MIIDTEKLKEDLSYLQMEFRVQLLKNDLSSDRSLFLQSALNHLEQNRKDLIAAIEDLATLINKRNLNKGIYKVD